MLRRLYDWILRLAATRYAAFALFAVAFGESFILPIPPDTLLAPMVLARPDKAWRNTALCAAGSVLGGVVGYYIGFALQPVAHQILALTGHAGAEAQIRTAFAQRGLWVILSAVVPIIPFPVITLSSGLAHFSFWPFLFAAGAARGARFVILTLLVRRFGPQVVLMLERRFAVFAIGLILLLVALVVAAKLLHHA